MKEISNAISERINNSFLGPYTIFFILYNWKIAIYLSAGKDDAQTRIENVLSYLGDKQLSYLYYPLIGAAIYILAIPIVVFRVDAYKNFIEVKKKKCIEKIRLEFDKTLEYKFDLARQLAEKVLLMTNSMITNNNPSSSRLRDLQKYLSAIQETGNKNISEHFSELRSKGEI